VLKKAAAAVFSAVLAPIGVFVATQQLSKTDSPPAPAEKPAAPPRPARPPADPAQVVAEGTGTTPDAALAEAHRNAVREVATRAVPPADRNRADRAIDRVAADGDALVRRSEEIGSVRERVMGRTVYWKKVRATVDHKALTDRLRTAGVWVDGNR
jgi:hypothetical protein